MLAPATLIALDAKEALMHTGKPLSELLTHSEPELVMGVVAPTGSNTSQFQDLFTDLVRRFHYRVNVIRLSDLVNKYQADTLGVPLDDSTEFRRLESLMKAGTQLRKDAGRGDILALHAILEIRRSRTDTEGKTEPAPGMIHLLRSLKHPEEVEALRRVYGPGFFLVGLYAPEPVRAKYLTERKGMAPEQAKQILGRDQSEADPLGQQTRQTFAMADVFVRAGDSEQLSRFLDLVFGEPFATPTRDEHSMFLAYAASLRSAQLGRQVGAVVVSAEGDVIATGANDVPRCGGGLYWSDDEHDARDDKRGFDSNDSGIEALVDNVVALPALAGVHEASLRQQLKACRLGDLTEFGRAVHAEMDALLACARTGARTRGGSIYTTTFPCHNCTKHIVAAGISRVFYVEPYPKSLALALHEDSISIDGEERTDRVLFSPFLGVAARRYLDLFSMRLTSGLPRRRKEAGEQTHWKAEDASPRIRMSPWSYLEREGIAVELINRLVESQGQTTAPERPLG